MSKRIFYGHMMQFIPRFITETSTRSRYNKTRNSFHFTIQALKIAECSLSTGVTKHYVFVLLPLQDVLQLLTFLYLQFQLFFASIARSVGNNPTLPTTAFTTISASGCNATSKSPSLPYTILYYQKQIVILKHLPLFAQRRFAEKILELPLLRSQYFSLQKKQRDGIGLGARRNTSKVCVPIDPLAPNKLMFS